MITGSFYPGDLATWHSGSAEMTWPPDGIRSRGTKLFTLNSQTNLFVMIVSSYQKHGRIVFANGGLWWCPITSLSGSCL